MGNFLTPSQESTKEGSQIGQAVTAGGEQKTSDETDVFPKPTFSTFANQQQQQQAQARKPVVGSEALTTFPKDIKLPPEGGPANAAGEAVKTKDKEPQQSVTAKTSTLEKGKSDDENIKKNSETWANEEKKCNDNNKDDDVKPSSPTYDVPQNPPKPCLSQKQLDCNGLYDQPRSHKKVPPPPPPRTEASAKKKEAGVVSVAATETIVVIDNSSSTNNNNNNADAISEDAATDDTSYLEHRYSIHVALER